MFWSQVQVELNILEMCFRKQKGMKMTLDPPYYRSELTAASNKNKEPVPNVQAKESHDSFIFADYLIGQTSCFVLPNQFRCLN